MKQHIKTHRIELLAEQNAGIDLLSEQKTMELLAEQNTNLAGVPFTH